MASPHDERWNIHLQNYRAFVCVHGRHPRRPSVDPLEARLSEWAHEQRRLHRGQRDQSLRPDRRAQLETIEGWDWNPRRGPSPRSDHWENQRAAVERHFAEHGRYPRLTADDPHERSLAPIGQEPGRASTPVETTSSAAAATTPCWRPRAGPLVDSRPGCRWSGCSRNSSRRTTGFPKRTPARTADVTDDDRHEHMLSMWCANQRRFERIATADKPYPEERRARLDRVPGWSWSKHAERGSARQAVSDFLRCLNQSTSMKLKITSTVHDPILLACTSVQPASWCGVAPRAQPCRDVLGEPDEETDENERHEQRHAIDRSAHPEAHPGAPQKVQIYDKRHRLLPGEAIYNPGKVSGVIGGGRAMAICKDMDFPDHPAQRRAKRHPADGGACQ